MESEEASVNISAYFIDICRLCLNKGTLLTFKHLEGDMVTTIFGFLEVLLDRKLPETICEQCFKELTQMALFVRKCKHSQSILQQIEEECAKMRATSHIQIEILDSDQLKETICVVDPTDFTKIKIKAERDCEGSEHDRADEDHISSTEKKLPQNITSFTKMSNHNNQKGPNNNVKTNTNDPNICAKCGDVVIKMKDHYKMSKSCRPKNIKCAECNMYFSKTERLRSHKVAHHWKETFPHFLCHICSKMFKYEVNLKRHVELHEAGPRFICEICGKSFTTKISLQDHVNLHTGEKPFSCCFCDKTFPMRSLRNVHQKTHTHRILKTEVQEEKHEFESAICDICNKQFAHLRALSLHKRSHDENRVFKCRTCKIEYSSRLLLMRHYQTHKEKNLYECNYCKKSFKVRSCLATHTRSHTGERPFLCTLCPKSFTQRAHLSYHMLLHKNEKSFVCKYCGKSFTLKGNLTVHLRIHTGERPYKCHVCGLGFRDSSARKRHVISKHGTEQVAYIKTVDVNEI